MRLLIAGTLVVSALAISPSAGAQNKPPAKEPELSFHENFQDFRLDSLEKRVEPNFASFDCSSPGYDSLTMRRPKLLLFVSCQNVEPYLEGHRITIHVGNPHSFGFSGLSGELQYGKDWAKEKLDLSISESLGAGAWTRLQIVVNPSKADDLRVLHLYLEAKSVSGRQARDR